MNQKIILSTEWSQEGLANCDIHEKLVPARDQLARGLNKYARSPN